MGCTAEVSRGVARACDPAGVGRIDFNEKDSLADLDFASSRSPSG